MPKQGFLEGMEPPSIPELDELADAYVEVRDARMELNRKEKEKQVILTAKMKDHGLTRYEYGDRVIEIKHQEKAKVRASQFQESDKGEEVIDE